MMNKRILKAVSAGILVLAVTAGIWISGACGCTRKEEERYGRFDLLLYTTGTNNAVVPLTLSPDSAEVMETPPLVYFESLKNAYLYLLLLNREKELTVLFPGPMGNFPRNYAFTRYFLPEGSNWETLLRFPGEYTLCFVVSTRRLPEVERRLSRYASYRKTNPQDSTGREIVTELLAEIAEHRREQEWIKNGDINPEWTGGTVRSAAEEVIFKAWSVPFRGIISCNLTFTYTPGRNDG